MELASLLAVPTCSVHITYISYRTYTCMYMSCTHYVHMYICILQNVHIYLHVRSQHYLYIMYTLHILVGCKHRASEVLLYIGGRGLVSQIIEPVTFARYAFIIALRNIALDGYLDTRRNI